MSSREEKLAAARKKLREFQVKTRADSDHSTRKSSTATISPTPSFTESDSRVLIGTESPIELSRLAYERRETMQISESPLNRPSPNDLGRQNGNDVVLNYGGTDDAISLSDLQCQIQYLQSQLSSREMAISVLVSERNDAHAELSKVQSELQHKTDMIEDVRNKYWDASRRINELENASPRPMTSVMVSQVEEELRGAQELAAQKLSCLEERLTELRSRLDGKISECESLNNQVVHLRNALAVAEVKIQQDSHVHQTIDIKKTNPTIPKSQFINKMELVTFISKPTILSLTTEETPQTHLRETELLEENRSMKKEIELLGRRLQAAAMEEEQATHRFQQYADQCSGQHNHLRTQLQDAVELGHALKAENASLTATIKKLEGEIANTKNRDNPMEERIGVLNKENVELFQQVQAKESLVSTLTSQLEDIKGVNQSLVTELENVTKKLKESEASIIERGADPALLAAIESDKVAASRAVSQNQLLKQQLSELQQAFIRVNDEKLELTDKILLLEHRNSELQSKATRETEAESDAQVNVERLRGQVASILTGLQRHRQNCLINHSKENECKHKSDDGDHHSHDHGHQHHSHDEHNDNDEGDLESLLDQISEMFETLRPTVHSHDHHQHDDHDLHGHEHSEKECHDDGHHHDSRHSEMQINELQRAVEQLQNDKALLLQRLGSPIEDPEVQGLLEVKLRRTMDEIAVLDEEKQRLEHLVVQLQGETETIGEYITLYHKQRLLLKQRSLEKDEQLVELSKDREELQRKLSSLNQLVSKLVSGKPYTAEANDEVQNTAEEIYSIITEIGNNKVVSAQNTAFEQCSCCSGRLITV